MGNIKKIVGKTDLGENKFNTAEQKWCLPFHIELKENIHIHWQNIRMEMDITDFINFVASLYTAYQRWIEIGMPNTSDKAIYLGNWVGEEDYDFNKDRDIKYSKGNKLRHHFRNFPRTEGEKLHYDNACQVELQKGQQYHIHYKNFRIELGEREMKEIAKIFGEV